MRWQVGAIHELLVVTGVMTLLGGYKLLNGLEVLLHAYEHDVVVAGVGDGKEPFILRAYILIEKFRLLEGYYLVPFAVDYQDGHGDRAYMFYTCSI